MPDGTKFKTFILFSLIHSLTSIYEPMHIPETEDPSTMIEKMEFQIIQSESIEITLNNSAYASQPFSPKAYQASLELQSSTFQNRQKSQQVCNLEGRRVNWRQLSNFQSDYEFDFIAHEVAGQYLIGLDTQFNLHVLTIDEFPFNLKYEKGFPISIYSNVINRIVNLLEIFTQLVFDQKTNQLFLFTNDTVFLLKHFTSSQSIEVVVMQQFKPVKLIQQIVIENQTVFTAAGAEGLFIYQISQQLNQLTFKKSYTSLEIVTPYLDSAKLDNAEELFRGIAQYQITGVGVSENLLFILESKIGLLVYSFNQQGFVSYNHFLIPPRFNGYLTSFKIKSDSLAYTIEQIDRDNSILNQIYLDLPNKKFFYNKYYGLVKQNKFSFINLSTYLHKLHSYCFFSLKNQRVYKNFEVNEDLLFIIGFSDQSLSFLYQGLYRGLNNKQDGPKSLIVSELTNIKPISVFVRDDKNRKIFTGVLGDQLSVNQLDYSPYHVICSSDESIGQGQLVYKLVVNSTNCDEKDEFFKVCSQQSILKVVIKDSSSNNLFNRSSHLELLINIGILVLITLVLVFSCCYILCKQTPLQQEQQNNQPIDQRSNLTPQPIQYRNLELFDNDQL